MSEKIYRVQMNRKGAPDFSTAVEIPQGEEMTNSEWKEFLAEKWGVSKACAKEMLHAMYAIKEKDSIKKGFDKRKGAEDIETAND